MLPEEESLLLTSAGPKAGSGSWKRNREFLKVLEVDGKCSDSWKKETLVIINQLGRGLGSWWLFAEYRLAEHL